MHQILLVDKISKIGVCLLGNCLAHLIAWLFTEVQHLLTVSILIVKALADDALLFDSELQHLLIYLLDVKLYEVVQPFQPVLRLDLAVGHLIIRANHSYLSACNFFFGLFQKGIKPAWKFLADWHLQGNFGVAIPVHLGSHYLQFLKQTLLFQITSLFKECFSNFFF